MSKRPAKENLDFNFVIGELPEEYSDLARKTLKRMCPDDHEHLALVLDLAS